MDTPTSLDPFKVLGLPTDAGEAEIRARYLELVRQFPPERNPEKFRELHAAFQAANDPLVIARRLISSPSEDPPKWSEALEEQQRNPPALSPRLLLSLGNHDQASSRGKAKSQSSDDDVSSGEADQKQHFVEQPHE
jgi:curved DNA-binding protein CbpA